MWVKEAKFRAMGRRTSYQSFATDIRTLSAFCFIRGKLKCIKKSLNYKATTGIFMKLSNLCVSMFALHFKMSTNILVNDLGEH